MQDSDKKPEAKEPKNEKQEWQYNQELAPKPNSKLPKTTAIAPWSSTEFIAHAKDTNWFVILGLAIIVVAGLVYVWSHDIFSTMMVIAFGVIFAIYARHQPREITYEISDDGIKIGPKFYNYGEFKSFSIVEEVNIGSIIFKKLKRFAPPASIFYDLSNEDKIVESLSHHLPHEEHEKDPIEKLMARIHF